MPARGVISEVSEVATEKKEAILEGVRLNIHLLGTNLAADSDVVFPANHVERVRNGEHVRSTQEGSKPAIPQRPEPGQQLNGAQTATHAVFCGLVFDTRRLAPAHAIIIGA